MLKKKKNLFTFVLIINCTDLNKHWALGGISLKWCGMGNGRRSDLKRCSLSKAGKQSKQHITGTRQPDNPLLRWGSFQHERMQFLATVASLGRCCGNAGKLPTHEGEGHGLLE